MQLRITSLLVLVCFSVFLQKAFAQKKSEWEPIYLLVTGHNVMDGVEASFKLGACNGEDVVLIKFKNQNDYPVKLEWADAIFSYELKWIYRKEINAKKSISIKAKESVEGDCTIHQQPDLVVKVKDFVSNKENVKRYLTSQLIVTPIQ